eukprot:1149143-Pelagomonas_calceolata.AAC.4
MGSLRHRLSKQKVLVGIWRVTGSTSLQDLSGSVRSNIVFNSTPNGAILFASKLHGTLMIQSQLFKVVTAFPLIFLMISIVTLNRGYC